jgi:hypothetical protein
MAVTAIMAVRHNDIKQDGVAVLIVLRLMARG